MINQCGSCDSMFDGILVEQYCSKCGSGNIVKGCIDEAEYSDCSLSFEQVSFEVSLCLKALPFSDKWNIESISKEIAKHLCLTSDNISRLK
jgi:hypothetical protein